MISVFHDNLPRSFPSTRQRPFGLSAGSASQNGVLLRAAREAGFQVFITNDSSIEFQQNVKKIGIGVIAIVGVRNRIEDLRPLIPELLDSLEVIKPGQVITIAG